MKLTVVHTASPELLAVLGGLLKSESKTHTAKPVTSSNGISNSAKDNEAESEITITEIRELATKLSKNDGKGEKVKTLLTEFNCKAITNLKADQYESFYAKLKAL